MALNLVIKKDSISADKATLTWSDQTGSYNSLSNSGGYGSPNETRASLYLKLFVIAKYASGDEEMTLTPDDEDPTLVTSWSHPHTKDTWYLVTLFAVEAWSGAKTYNDSDIVYNTTTETFYKSLVTSNLNNALPTSGDNDYWEETSSYDDFMLTTTTSGTTGSFWDSADDVIYDRTQYCADRHLLLDDCDCNCKCTNKLFQKYQFEIDRVTNALNNFNYTKARDILDGLETECDSDTSYCNDC